MSGKTAKLFTPYIRLVNLLKNFIRAERSGDWDLHLQCVRNMLPYFHATGHHLYAKSTHLYLQDMENLAQEDYDLMSRNFTIRRTKKFWSGVWSDMTIEQTLMRSMHAAGGLTHGRGMKDNVISQWINSMPASTQICDAIESYAHVHSASSYQHIDYSAA